MPIDSSIAMGIRPVQVESPLNALAQVLQAKGLQNQNDLAQYTLGKAKRTDDDMNALMVHLQNGGDLSTDAGQRAAMNVAPLSAPGFIKTRLDQQKTVADTAHASASATKAMSEATEKRLGQWRDLSQQITTPESAASFLQAMRSDPTMKDTPIAQVPLDQALAQIPKDPAQLETWKQKFAVGATKYIELNKPNIQVRNTGGSTDVISVPGLGGSAQVLSSVKNTTSPDAVLQAGTSRANNAATIAAENLRAGISPDGSVSSDVEAQAQAIAKGQLLPPSGAALINPKNAKVLARVMEINPDYDATTVLAKKKAAADFASGQLGNALRSVSTANAHLDQLGELAEALGNGNAQVVNKVTNYFSKATGNPAVTNFDAIKQVVGQEVVKAIVAGGGGVTERDEAAKAFGSANSPAQLKGVIQHFRMIMGAQANNLMEQRRAAGLPDSTLPDYTKTNSGGGGGSPNPVVNAIDAELARRGGK